MGISRKLYDKKEEDLDEAQYTLKGFTKDFLP